MTSHLSTVDASGFCPQSLNLPQSVARFTKRRQMTGMTRYHVSKSVSHQVLRRSARLEQREAKRIKAGLTPKRSHLPSPETENPPLESYVEVKERTDLIKNPKRKRCAAECAAEPSTKRVRTRPPIDVPSHEYEDNCDPTEFWVKNGNWPPQLAAVRSEMETPLSIKRSRAQSPAGSQTNSYTQGVRDGENPAAWSRHHERKMLEAGLIMAEYQTQVTVTEECLKLCDTILHADYPPPDGPLFRENRLLQVLDQVQFRNEAMVAHRITPIIVPSAEELHICNHEGLEFVTEAMEAEWLQCDTLCGPRPKPDQVAGVSASAFSQEEVEKLRLNHTSACPNLFPEGMFYPFLICEVKGSDRPIQEAERQAMHSASIAARAIVRLYMKASLAQEVDRRILTISISHNNSQVRVFGHFVHIDDEKLTFYRHHIYSAYFVTEFADPASIKAYKITRAIYQHFFPDHLSRIRRALDHLRGPALESFTSQLGLGDVGDERSPDRASSVSSSQEGPSKRASRASTGKLQQENDRLREQLMSFIRREESQHARRMEEQQEQKKMMEQQLSQQKAEQVEQKKMMEQQLAQQKAEQVEQKKLMEQQLAQQKAEQVEQKKMMEQQLAQQQEIIELLKQSNRR